MAADQWWAHLYGQFRVSLSTLRLIGMLEAA